jgi:proteasome beta subunit
LLAGYDNSGEHLYDLTPDGVIHEIEDYSATGAGFMQAHPILDSEYRKDMSTKEGIDLAVKCIKTSLGREPSVGDGLDVYVVKDGEVKEVMNKEIHSELKDKSR